MNTADIRVMYRRYISSYFTALYQTQGVFRVKGEMTLYDELELSKIIPDQTVTLTSFE
jgi:hypothetical protein